MKHFHWDLWAKDEGKWVKVVDDVPLGVAVDMIRSYNPSLAREFGLRRRDG